MNIKSIFTFLIMATMTLPTISEANTCASSLSREEQYNQIVQKIYEDYGLAIVSVGLGACHPTTGEETNTQNPFVECVVILTLDSVSTDRIRQTYPTGSKMFDFFIYTKTSGGRPEPILRVIGNG